MSIEKAAGEAGRPQGKAMQVEAGFGDTHNDLRFAVSQLSGSIENENERVVVEREATPASGRNLQRHAEGQPVVDLQYRDRAVAHFVELPKQIDNLWSMGDVLGFPTRSAGRAELDFPDDPGRCASRRAGRCAAQWT